MAAGAPAQDPLGGTWGDRVPFEESLGPREDPLVNETILADRLESVRNRLSALRAGHEQEPAPELERAMAAVRGAEALLWQGQVGGRGEGAGPHGTEAALLSQAPHDDDWAEQRLAEVRSRLRGAFAERSNIHVLETVAGGASGAGRGDGGGGAGGLHGVAGGNSGNSTWEADGRRARRRRAEEEWRGQSLGDIFRPAPAPSTSHRAASPDGEGGGGGEGHPRRGRPQGDAEGWGGQSLGDVLSTPGVRHGSRLEAEKAALERERRHGSVTGDAGSLGSHHQLDGGIDGPPRTRRPRPPSISEFGGSLGDILAPAEGGGGVDGTGGAAAPVRAPPGGGARVRPQPRSGSGGRAGGGRGAPGGDEGGAGGVWGYGDAYQQRRAEREAAARRNSSVPAESLPSLESLFPARNNNAGRRGGGEGGRAGARARPPSPPLQGGPHLVNLLRRVVYRKPRHRDKDSSSQHSECSICLSDFEERQVLRRYKCGHLFHQRCIEEWMRADTSCRCPLCRRDPRT